MAKDYKGIPTPELERMWNERRLSMKIGADRSMFRRDMEEVYAMRRELDRRRGDVAPSSDVNFEQKYLTD